MKRDELSNEDILKVFEKKGGNLTATAASLGINRRTLVRWRDADDDLRIAMKDVEESLVDFSESKLIESINEGNLTAIIFHLKTKGKDRGYVESVENKVKVEQPVTLSMKEAQGFIKELENEY